LIGQRVKKASGTLIFLLVISMLPEALAQPVPDSIISPYDSVQDLRRRRWETGLESRLHGLDTSVHKNASSVDSARMLLQVLQESMRNLEEVQKVQQRQLDTMAVRLGQARDSAEVFRKNLRRNLWIITGLLFLLLAASFAYLVSRSMTTRTLLQKLRRKLRRDRKMLEGRIARQEENLGTALGSQERRFKKKLKAIKRSRSRKK